MNSNLLDRFPDIRDTVRQINDLFKQQLCARQVKKYECALYLSAIQYQAEKLLTHVKKKLAQTSEKNASTNQLKFDAISHLQITIQHCPSKEYTQALKLLSQIQDVMNDRTDSSAKAILKTLSQPEREEKKERRASSTAEPLDSSQKNTLPFQFVRRNLLGANKKQAQVLYNVIQYLQGGAA